MTANETQNLCDAMAHDPDMVRYIRSFIDDDLPDEVGKLHIWMDNEHTTGAPRRSPWTKNMFVNFPWILEQERGREIVAKFLLTH